MGRNWLYCVMLFILPGFQRPEGAGAVSWVVMPGSSLSVNGSTNVNTFQCEIINYSEPDTLVCNPSVRGQVLPMQGRLVLNIESFDCHNKMMTNDLRKTLQYKNYPHLSIRFLSLNSFPDFRNPARINGVVDISLAGVTKRFEIAYLFTSDASQTIHLKGERVVSFTDFNLSPPSKLGGIIRAKDELRVAFRLNLKPVEKSGSGI